MTRNNQPDDLGTILKDIRRRLHALETAPRLGNSSIKEGALRILDEDNVERARFGRLELDYDGDGVTDWGLALFTKYGFPNLLVSDVGWVAPGQITPLAPSANPDIFRSDSATYEEVGRVDFIATSRDWTWDSIVNAYGADMSFRFLAAIVGDTPVPIYEETAPTPGGQYGSTFNLPDILSNDALIGQTVTIRLELRVDSGVAPASFRFLTSPINWIAP